MPPLPRRAMGPDRNCRQLDCPVPIAHRGRGSAEVDLKATFSYKKKLGHQVLIKKGLVIKRLEGLAALAFQPKITTDTLGMLMNFWLSHPLLHQTDSHRHSHLLSQKPFGADH